MCVVTLWTALLMANGSQMETLDIQLHLSNINWEDGYSPCKSLKPLIHSLKLKKKKAAHGLQKQKSYSYHMK